MLVIIEPSADPNIFMMGTENTGCRIMEVTPFCDGCRSILSDSIMDNCQLHLHAVCNSNIPLPCKRDT